MIIEPVGQNFVAIVREIDLAQPLSPEAVKAVEAAMDMFAVLVFPNQPMTGDEQLAFTNQFGPPDRGLAKLGGDKAGRLGNRDLADISNVDIVGNVTERNDRKIVSNMANQLWHSDSSFQNPPARYSILSAVAIPDQGGDTEFADMRWAYDRLDPDLRLEVESLVAEHYVLHSRLALGDDAWTDEQRRAMPPVQWPIVRTHPGSGRKLLFLGAHITHILGMTVAEGRMLLNDLLEDATDKAFTYRHRWTANDAVMWDNRSTLHRGRRFDVTKRREMRRSTTEDVLPRQHERATHHMA